MFCHQIKSAYMKLVFSPKTNYLLNYLTLRISDKDIAQKVTLYHFNLLKKTFWIQTIVATSSLIKGLVNYFQNTIPFVILIISILLVMNQVITWALLKYNVYSSTRQVFIYLLIYVVMMNLYFYDVFSTALPQDKYSYSQEILLNFMIVSSYQYNTIQFTVFFQIPLLLIGSAFQYNAECNFSGLLFKNCSEYEFQECSQFIQRSFSKVAIISLAVIIGHYLRQQELSVLIIEKELISKQQVQLQQFLLQNKDGVVILSEQDTKDANYYKGVRLELCNQVFKIITGLDPTEDKSNDEDILSWQNKKVFQIADNMNNEENIFEQLQFDQSSKPIKEKLMSFLQVYDTINQLKDKGSSLEFKVFATSQALDQKDSDINFTAVKVTMQSLIFNSRQCKLLIFDDVTNVKKLAYVEFYSEKMQLRQSSVSHEMLTPLNCITDFAEQLKISCKKNPDQVKIVQMIQSTSKLVSAQVNQLLDKNLLDRNNLHPNLQLVSLVEIVKDTISIFECQANHLKIQLKYVGPSKGCLGSFDSIRVQQILINLLSNAIKFSHQDQKILIILQEQHNALNEQDYLVYTIKVVDFGIGINQQDMENLYSPFFKSCNQQSRQMNMNGHGLGLNICLKLARLLGGNLTVQSEIEKGSTFTLTLKSRTQEVILLDQISSNKTLTSHQKSQEIQAFNFGDYFAQHQNENFDQSQMNASLKIERILSIENENIRLSSREQQDYKNLLDNITAKKELNQFQNEKIIVADDQAINLAVIKTHLETVGVLSACSFVVNGDEAVKLAIQIIDKSLIEISQNVKVRPIALMLLDLQMPVKNGITVVQELRNYYARKRLQHPNLIEPEFVFLTAFWTKSLDQYLKQLKIRFCYQKPISIQLLTSLIHEVFESVNSKVRFLNNSLSLVDEES